MDDTLMVLDVTRPGISSRAFGDDLAGYAASLAARWRAYRDEAQLAGS